jgi:F-type H+-transporting ATPase subunit delta
MKEQNVAKVYAKSFLELGTAHNVKIADELTSVTEVINSSNDLENLLFLDVFSPEEKKDVFNVIASKIKISDVLTNAINYLIEQKRIGLLPFITKEVIVVDDHEKGFIRGSIEGFEASLPSDVKKDLEEYIAKKTGKKPVLEYQQNEGISAGYRVTVEDLQLDASVDNQLERFKESLLN